MDDIRLDAAAEQPHAGGFSPWGWWLAVAGLVAVFGCCVVSVVTCRPAVDVNTFYPNEGATMDAVRAEYGPPSDTFARPDGTTTWYYYTDRCGWGITMVGVNFDVDGRVTSSFNH